MPFFSIIIPTYNRSKKLKRAIDSVLAQTFTDFEILVMDDGSTDDTPDIMAEYKDKRIIYQWDINSGGPARPRNRGLKIAKGEWICFLDADDYWTLNKLQYCFDLINKNVDFIFHDLLLVNGRKNLFFFYIDKLKGRKLSIPIVDDLLLNGNEISTSSVVVRRSILAQTVGFDESKELVAGEDFKLWLNIAMKTNNFFYINESLGYYLDSGNGISEKNMSLVYYNAIVDYLHMLSFSNKNRALTFSKYINAKYVISSSEQYIPSCVKELIFCLRYAKFEIRLKSLFLIFFTVYKGVKNKISNIFRYISKYV